jgi:hypothetical protein
VAASSQLAWTLKTEPFGGDDPLPAVSFALMAASSLLTGRLIMAHGDSIAVVLIGPTIGVNDELADVRT